MSERSQRRPADWTFSLATGKGLSDPAYEVRTVPARIEGDDVNVNLPPTEALERGLPSQQNDGCGGSCSKKEASWFDRCCSQP